MTSRASSTSRSLPQFPKLPWVIAGLFFVLYLITLSEGAGIIGVGAISTVTGWDWTPPLRNPLYHVVTLPFRILPDSISPGLLNFFSALLAAGTLGLVARSVQLLPQDRTRDQRERERGEKGLLTGPTAWLPATTAAGLCGLQMLFWQNATNASPDMLNLFVMAWIVRELLEFRVDGRESRLVRVALLYGLGITSNAALIALFPFALGAIIWIMGKGFFRSPLILKLTVAGLAGLLLYLLLPVLAVASDRIDITFWEALRSNVGPQKHMLATGFGSRLFVMVMCLGSLFPIILIAVRWPSSMGDTSAAGNLLTLLMFRVLALLFIAGSLAMNFGMAHAAKAQQETGLAFHSLFLLSSIVLGYASGYLLVVFGKRPGKAWKRPGPVGQLINMVMVGFAWLLLPGVVGGLGYKNFNEVRALNGGPLHAHVEAIAGQLKGNSNIALSDDPLLLNLVEARVAKFDDAERPLLVNSTSLNFPGYHHHLQEKTDGAWPELPADVVSSNAVSQIHLVNLMAGFTTNRPVSYLHPSFGYYFEVLHAKEDGHVLRLELYPPDTLAHPHPGDDGIARHQEFLESAWSETLQPVARKLADHTASGAEQYLAAMQSRAFNAWGVRLQRARGFEGATPWFERAVQLNTNNASARINLEYNRHRLGTNTEAFTLSDETTTVVKNYRDNTQFLVQAGGPLDEPANCLTLGLYFSAGNLHRQAAQQFLRSMELAPGNHPARLELARSFLQFQSPDRALETLRDMRSAVGDDEASKFILIDLASLEASAHFAKNEPEKAVSTLEQLRAEHPEQPIVFDILSQQYLGQALYRPDFIPRADSVIQQQARLSPTNLLTLYNLGTVAFLKHDWAEAELHYNRLLEAAPDDLSARFNRAVAYLRSEQYDKALAEYRWLEERSPNSFQIEFGLGTIAELQSRREDAIRHFEKYLALAPKTIAEYTNVTQRLEKLKGQ
ncbi:MAG TPA: hypothetical protein DCY13_15565 [Verrucomicrobiales bacterium]|nr:hypothetical protein [Verrucomicrobiales bacterium]